MAKVLSLLLLLLFSTHPLSSSEARVGSAISAYQKGDYQGALEQFKSLNAQPNSALYYNLGNCYLKLNQIPEAITAYFAALKRNPRNRDCIHNLNYAESLLPDRLDFPSEIQGIQMALKNLVLSFSIKTHQIFFLISFSVLLFSLFLRNGFIHLREFKPLVTSLLFVTLCSISSLTVRHIEFNKTQGILKSPQSSIRYAPGLSETEAFVLKAGSRFNIIRMRNNWAQIEVPGGKGGWIEKKEFLFIP